MTSFTVWCPHAGTDLLASITAGISLPAKGDVQGVNPKGSLPPLPGGVLLMLGGTLLNQIKEAKLVKKNASLTSCREQVFTLNNTQILVSFDPLVTEREAERKVDLIWDLQLASRLAATGSLAPDIGQYVWVENFNSVMLVDDEATDRVAVDLETIGLDPWAEVTEERPAARILTIALTPEEGRSYVYRVPESGKPSKLVLKQLRAILCGSTKVTGANLKYDLGWLAKHWGIEGVNQTFDTHLVGSLLDENRSNSLETHAKVYTSMGGYDTDFNRRYDKSRMDLALDQDPDGFLQYAGGDTDACYRVTTVQRRLLTRDKRLKRFYVRLLQPAARVFAKVEQRGVLVDRERYVELEKECRHELATVTQEAFACLPRRLLLKYADNLSLTRPSLIREFMFTKRGLNLKPRMITEAGWKIEAVGGQVDRVEYASTASEHMQMFADHPEAGPFVRAMGKHNATKKTLDTYIVGFQKHIRADGYFHPTYRLGRGSSHEDLEGGAVTGRTSATDPAYQTITKRGVWAKPLRSVYPCPPGYGIGKLDFNQGELRIMACVANDPTMITAYRSNTDLHSLTAATTMGLTLPQFVNDLDEWVREEKRRAAKAINFGLLYGMMPPGLVDYARKSYGVDMTLSQAEEYWQAFFDLYDRLQPYHAKIKRTARSQGFVRNPLGRIRHLPLITSSDREIRSMAERQSINSPIQSCLSDLMLLAMVEIDRRWPDLWIFGMTHDSLEMYLPLDKLLQLAAEVKAVLENLPVAQFGWTPQVTFVADAEIATEGTFADIKKCRL